MPPAEIYASGTIPQIADTPRTLLVKLVNATKGISVGDISGVTGVYAWDGAGAMPSAPGAAILVGDGAKAGFLWVKTTGANNNTDWVAL